MTKVLSVVCLTVLGMMLGCSSQESSTSEAEGRNYNESDAVRNWGAQMLDDQATYYQDLFVKLTKLAGSEQGSAQVKFWLEGSDLSPSLVQGRVNAHYCYFDQAAATSSCQYRELKLQSFGSETDDKGNSGYLGQFEVPLDGPGQQGDKIRLRVSYCEVSCGTSILEFSAEDGEVSNSNRTPIDSGSDITH